MNEKQYRLSRESILDLEEIWLYSFENWSIEQADRYIDLIIDEIEYLSLNKGMGRNLNYFCEGYRVSRVKSHLIFYKANEKNQIDIIRILHERMDIVNRLI